MGEPCLGSAKKWTIKWNLWQSRESLSTNIRWYWHNTRGGSIVQRRSQAQSPVLRIIMTQVKLHCVYKRLGEMLKPDKRSRGISHKSTFGGLFLALFCFEIFHDEKFLMDWKKKTCIKRSWRDGSAVQTIAALVEDPKMVANTHVVQLTDTYTSRSRGSDTCWPLWTLAQALHTFTHTQTYM